MLTDLTSISSPNWYVVPLPFLFQIFQNPTCALSLLRPNTVQGGPVNLLLWTQALANFLQPFEIRLKIWSLQAPSPRTLIQVKPPGYKPRHTFTEAQPAPAVMHVCRESRKEYLYRSDDEANNAERKTHALYGPIFSDDDGKVSFFSYEVDELHLMTFSMYNHCSLP